MNRPTFPARRRWRAIAFAIALSPAAGAAAQTPPCDESGTKMAMWQVIDDHCIANPTASSTKDCVVVDDHIVIARDSFKPNAFLVVARDDVCGIEDDAIRRPDAPNYWLAGWNNRKLVGADWTVGLAINSKYRRSQNRLHIHIDRLCKNIAAALDAVDASRHPLSDLALKDYRALSITLDQIANGNVFALVAAAMPMVPPADQSIALVAAKDDPAKAIAIFGSIKQGSGHAEDLFSYGGRCGG